MMATRAASDRTPAASGSRQPRRRSADAVETITVVLNVLPDQVEAFESGFREHELPVWRDLRERGLLIAATLNRLDISSRPVDGTVQYSISVIFSSGEGHHVHDSHPGF